MTLNSHHFFMYVHQKTSQGLINYFHIHNIFLRLCHLRFHIPKNNYNLLSVLLFWSLLTKKSRNLTEYCYSHLTRSHYLPKNYSRRYPHYNQLKYVQISYSTLVVSPFYGNLSKLNHLSEMYILTIFLSYAILPNYKIDERGFRNCTKIWTCVVSTIYISR